jgi:hypothetical protein
MQKALRDVSRNASAKCMPRGAFRDGPMSAIALCILCGMRSALGDALARGAFAYLGVRVGAAHSAIARLRAVHCSTASPSPAPPAGGFAATKSVKDKD